MAQLLSGKAALITGAAQGIGLAIAQQFCAQGAAVMIVDIDGDSAAKAASRLAADGLTAQSVACNVGDEAQVRAAVNLCSTEFGSIDIMVNNAGITRDATLRAMTTTQFDEVIATHLRGTWLGVREAGNAMREQRSGAIINMSSISGKVGLIGQTNYSAAKAGIVGLTKAAAKELARHNIRVNAIQPGLIRTAMTEAMRPDIWEQKMTEIPLGRAGEPAEIASVATFLASDMSSYITAAVLEVTGGRYA
jgi:3-oxoacyl-[acyl-carrier protein] reductase